MYTTGSCANYACHFVKEIIFQIICIFLHVTYKRCFETNEFSLTHGLQAHNLAKQILKLCTSLRSLSFT